MDTSFLEKTREEIVIDFAIEQNPDILLLKEGEKPVWTVVDNIPVMSYYEEGKILHMILFPSKKPVMKEVLPTQSNTLLVINMMKDYIKNTKAGKEMVWIGQSYGWHKIK